MTKNLNNEFNTNVKELAKVSKSLSHPARIVILQILSKHKDRTCKELVAELPLSQPTVSQHLKELLNAGLICRTNKGAQSLYCMEWNRMERVFTVLGRFGTKILPNRPKRNCC